MSGDGEVVPTSVVGGIEVCEGSDQVSRFYDGGVKVGCLPCSVRRWFLPSSLPMRDARLLNSSRKTGRLRDLEIGRNEPLTSEELNVDSTIHCADEH